MGTHVCTFSTWETDQHRIILSYIREFKDSLGFMRSTNVECVTATNTFSPFTLLDRVTCLGKYRSGLFISTVMNNKSNKQNLIHLLVMVQ